ncbi:hypothetical protein T08_877 [Trichinella sp. T8]|nr:hypothetical protein T08_10665 [Trichinella sp. T8]KRZ86657.1 hypothetical protein T08_877 [Trichinella sp. T8]
MGMLPTFFRKSRERPDQQPPVYVFCTFPMIFDRMMPTDSILDSKTFTMGTDNVMESSIRNYPTVVE